MPTKQLPDSPTEMLFPPYIAQPCQLACCRPMSSSVPRYVANNNNNHINTALRRHNSFSLTNNIDNEDDECNDLIPPRPPEMVQSMVAQASNEMPKRLTSYEMIPIIKPASSMPNGLPDTQASVANDMAGTNGDDGLLTEGLGTHYHGSQPNIMMTSFRSNSRSTNKTDNISNLTASTTLNSSTLSNLTTKSGGISSSGASVTGRGGMALNSYGNGHGSGPLGSSRYSSRATSIEPRTTAYYYHELAQKSNVFDSNLNLLNDNKTDNTIPTTIAETLNTRQEQHVKGRQQLLGNSDGHKLSSFNGSLDNVLETTRKNLDDLILGNSLLYKNAHSSNDLLNCNNNGNSSSAGTLVDENLNLNFSQSQSHHHHLHNHNQNQISNNTSNNNNPIPAARNVLSSNSGYMKRSSQNLHHSSSNTNIRNSSSNNGNNNNHSNNNSNPLSHHHNEKYIA